MKSYSNSRSWFLQIHTWRIRLAGAPPLRWGLIRIYQITNFEHGHRKHGEIPVKGQTEKELQNRAYGSGSRGFNLRNWIQALSGSGIGTLIPSHRSLNGKRRKRFLPSRFRQFGIRLVRKPRRSEGPHGLNPSKAFQFHRLHEFPFGEFVQPMIRL